MCGLDVPLPTDYEECGECGYDHEYAPAKAHSAHVLMTRTLHEQAVLSTVYKSVGVEVGGKLPALTFPGLYTILYITESSNVVCAECASEYEIISDPITTAGTYDEGDTIPCSMCAKGIESSYGPVSDR